MNQFLAPRPIANTHRPYLLITGATGLLGQYLVRDLLDRGLPLAILARSNKRQSSLQRIEANLQRIENELQRRLPRPLVIEADVCKPDLGLNKRQLQWIAQNCHSVLHNAASLQFFGNRRTDEPWLTNFVGTRNVLDLARRAEIDDFHHVSTAYVCGQRAERVLENEFDCGQLFRNDYEESKFAAEHLVRSANHFRSTTIYRPVVIAGDSRTGYTSTYHGLFLYLRLISTVVPTLKRNGQGFCETPIKLPLDGNEPRNLVSVDWVSQVMTHLISTPAAHGQTFHLAPDRCLTAKEFIQYCGEYFSTCGVEFIGRDAGRFCDNEFASRMFENVKIYEPYETSDPQFDKSNLLKFASEFPCPALDKQVIFRYIEFGQANRWGKQRYLPVVAPASLTPMVEASV